MVLAGDIGATKSLLAYFSPKGYARTALNEKSFWSQKYPGLEAVLRTFLASHPAEVKIACFGLPGPVVDGRCETPNLPWVVDLRKLKVVLGNAQIILLNDLQIMAYGIPTLRPDELYALSEGKPHPEGNQALIAPGTGLGEAILFFDGMEHKPVALRYLYSSKRPRPETTRS